MGPDLELNRRSEVVMEASTSKENGSAVKESEDKDIRCASNCEDNTFEMEVSLNEKAGEVHRGEDVEVNIMEFTNSRDTALFEIECQDATEHSSSFGNTVSEVENGAMCSDTEVMSRSHTSAPAFDRFGELFRMRKKKLTSHWRTFIQPLMWRCKWVELQIKKLQSQAVKYDAELAHNNQKKEFKLENFPLEGFGAKTLPFSGQGQREKVTMMRKKRKRIEDTMDTTAYMSHHNLFSFYENRRSTADGASLDDDWGNLAISSDKKLNGTDEFGATDEQLLLEFKGGDDTLEHILRKIVVVQSQVTELKTRLNKVMSENAGKFSSTDKLSLIVPCNALASSTRNPASPPNNGDRMPVGSSYIASQLMPAYNMGDLVMPESAVSSHAEVTHLPDIVESTDQPQVGGSCKNTGDRILIYSRRAKEELNEFKEVKVKPIETLQVPKEELVSTIPPVPVLEDLPTDDKPTPKIRSISKLTSPKNKRKRGRRKAGSARWSQRSSG